MMLQADQSQTGMERALAVLVFVGGLLLCVGLTWSFSQQINQKMVAMLLGAVLVVIGLTAPIVSISLVFIYLAIMGDVRRLFIFQSGVSEADPLLLVGPLAAGTLALVPFLKGKLDFESPLPRLIVILTMLMFLEILNPYQGGLIVGLAGGLFYIVPLVWFWIGQAYGTQAVMRTVIGRVVVFVGIAACVMGLWQTFVGFTAYQDEWIAIIKQKYVAINITGRIRPFAFFVSPAEFAHYCIVIVVIGFAPLVKKQLRPVVFLVPLAVACIVFQAGRGALLFAAVACGAMWAVAGKNITPLAVVGKLLVATVVGVLALILGLGSASQANLSSSIAPMIERQAQGLLNPLDTRQSTLVDHVLIAASGVTQGIRYPLGKGLGASTMAGAKYSDETNASTEMDFSNMFVSLGIVGGILYLCIVCYIFVIAWRVVRKTQSATSLIIFGILVSQLMHWLNGGHYAVAAIVWFCVGALDRQYTQLKREERAAA